MLLCTAGANAALNLSRPPLFVKPPPAPNIIFTFDDSGSMERAYTPNEAWDVFLPGGDGLDACKWRDYPHLFSSDANGQYYDPLVTYVPPVYADGTSFPPSSFYDAYLDGFAAYRTQGTPDTTINKRNLGLNYRMSITFGASLANAGQTTVRFDLVRAATCATGQNRPWVLEGARGVAPDVGFVLGTSAIPPPPTTAASQRQRAFYFTYDGPRSGPGGKPTLMELYGHTGVITTTAETVKFNRMRYVAHLIPVGDVAAEQNFANWYTYYRTRNLMGRTAAAVAFSQLPSNVRLAWQGLNENQLVASTPIAAIGSTSPPISTQRVGFFKYLHEVLAPSGTPTRQATQRVTDYLSNANTSLLTESNPYYDAKISATTGVPTVVSCRQNYHMVFTDGGWNTPDGAFSSPKNYDQNAPNIVNPLPETWISPGVTRPAYGGPYATTNPNTRVYDSGPSQDGKAGYADVAFYGWATDLRTDLNNNVEPFIGDRTTSTAPPLPPDIISDPQVYWNPGNDPATWQHVVQFVVAFGLTSTLDFPGDLPSLRSGAKVWTEWNGTTGEGGEGFQKVDDTWHATLNSRGELFSANNPQEVVQQMNQVFQSITDRTASVSAVSVSSSLLTTASLSYQTFFNASSWSGTVQGKQRQANSNVDKVVWDVACRLDGGPCSAIEGTPSFVAPDPMSDRKISTGSVDFTWGSLSGAQRTALNKDFDNNGAVDTRGPDRLAYIRGVRTLEGSFFRTRASRFGAVVNSNALVVGAANDNYWRPNQDPLRPLLFPLTATTQGPEIKGASDGSTAGSFLAHVEAIKNRPTTVYVGANDGMLHALDAFTGVERWAFVPNAVFKNLARLTSKSNLFTQSYVDSTPVVREVFIGSQWRTLLVGALRLGGQGVYALDVTDPNPITPAARFKWEFNDGNDTDVGFTYGRPIIARARGGWVVLVPGGYNADVVAEGVNPAAGSQRAVLYVLNANTGALIRKFSGADFPGADSDSIGLSSIVGGDYVFEAGASSAPLQVLTPDLGAADSALRRTQDQVMDVAFAGDNQGNVWRFNFESATPSAWNIQKFFAGGQPVTAQPRIATAKGYAVIAFGSGRFVDDNDRTVVAAQRLYGIYDPGPNYTGYPITPASLVNQTTTKSTGPRGIQLSTTDNPVAVSSTRLGWRVSLTEVGERSIVAATSIFNPPRLIFPTFTPNGDPTAANDPCRETGISSIYILNPENGGPARSEGFAAFDVNRDGVINGLDNPTVSGFQLPGFVAGATAVNQAGGGEFTVLGIPLGGEGGSGVVAAGSTLSGLCGGTNQPACVCDGPGLPNCGCGPNPPGGIARPLCGECVDVVTDFLNQVKCKGSSGLNQPIWRRMNSRDLPAWDPNERN